MRKLILSMQMSLDGFVEGVAGDMSWMEADSKEGWADHFSMFRNVDLYMLGSGMWEDYRDYWQKANESEGFSKEEKQYAEIALSTPHLVFSTKRKSSGWKNAKISKGPLGPVIKKYKNQPGKDIQVVGGAKFAAAVIDTGLVDEYRIVINPAILAKGKSLFSSLTNKHRLEFIEMKLVGPATVILRYRQLDSIPVAEKKKTKDSIVKKGTNKLAGKESAGFFDGMSQPAANALKHAGLHNVKKLALQTEKEVLSLHGVGKASLPVFYKKLKEAGLSFKK